MSLLACIALTIFALLAVGAGAWLMLIAAVAAIVPCLPLSTDTPMRPWHPVLLAGVAAIGAIVFTFGASGCARLAMLA